MKSETTQGWTRRVAEGSVESWLVQTICRMTGYSRQRKRAGKCRDEHVIDVFSDSDWAACQRSRRSTSGGVTLIDGGTVKHWNSTQATIASSVGEAENYALVTAAAEGLTMVALGRDLGYELSLRIWVDSTTAKAIVTRLGLGKVRHMEVKFLWAQEALRRICKMTGERNPADVLTKAMSMVEMKEKIESTGGIFSVAEHVGRRLSFGLHSRVVLQ